MSFLYPLGLLGLIGIPILIAVYIIKSKYTEQTVASTFLWRLSERFLKRKNPISRVTGIISLILQILAVTIVSLAIAHPVITVSSSAHEYCFILDASGSMNISEGEDTRFALAKDEISTMIKDATGGSRFSLICVGDTTRVVFERLEDKAQAQVLLESLEASYSEIDYVDAIGVAQGYFDENPSVQTYLVTDTNYVFNNNVTLINVGTAVENYALKDVAYMFSGGTMTVTGKVTAYEGGDTVSLQMFLDGSETPNASGEIVAASYVETPFQLTCDADSFSTLCVRVTNEDSLPEDNEVVIFNTKSEITYKTLIVSDTPFFLESVLLSVSNARVDVLSTEEYDGRTGYGLYVFDSYTPAKMPRDGTVWLINPRKNLDQSGFSVQDPDVIPEKGVCLEPSSSTSSTVQKLIGNLTGDEIYVAKYVKCGLYQNFTTLFSYAGNPIVFAGTNAFGNREVVFAFSLNNSNMPLLTDFVLLTGNLLEYSFPDFIEKVSYYSGEEVEINVLANCESIQVHSPRGNISYLDVSGAVSRFELTEVGVYTLTLTVAGTPRDFYIYAAMPEAERTPVAAAQELSLQGMPSTDGFDGKYDNLIILFVLLMLVFAADWGVYCYEKYQLR